MICDYFVPSLGLCAPVAKKTSRAREGYRFVTHLKQLAKRSVGRANCGALSCWRGSIIPIPFVRSEYRMNFAYAECTALALWGVSQALSVSSIGACADKYGESKLLTIRDDAAHVIALPVNLTSFVHSRVRGALCVRRYAGIVSSARFSVAATVTMSFTGVDTSCVTCSLRGSWQRHRDAFRFRVVASRAKIQKWSGHQLCRLRRRDEDTA